MYQVIEHSTDNKDWNIIYQNENYDTIKEIYNSIYPADKLPFEAKVFELIEIRGGELIGLEIKKDNIITIIRKGE